MAPVCAVVVAGGSGQRFGNPGGKQLVNVAGRPLMSWSIRAFDRSDRVGHIVVVCPAERRAEMRRLAISPFDYDTPISFADAGDTRQDSTRAGVHAVPAGFEYVAIHDGARPLITTEAIDHAIDVLVGDRSLDGVVCGQPAIDTLKIVDGELWLRGENIMDGYLDPEANKQAFCDGWFRTGDLVRFDEEGFLYITGRIKEVLVLPSGEKVSPAELETLFNTIEAVQDSLVYVDSHGVLSLQVVPRQVVLKAQGIADPEAHIRAEVEKINAGLPGFERVSKIIVRDADFERSPSMKILREKNAQSDHS